MELIQYPYTATGPGRPVVALGNFDGFHRGHQVVVGEAGRLARSLDQPLAVAVTEPHPVQYFRPDSEPFRLTPDRERALLMQRFGVDQLFILPFDSTLAGMPAQNFVRDVLLGTFSASHLVVGYDYRFGQGRGGNTDMLAQMSAAGDFGLTIIAPVAAESGDDTTGEAYSSTLIRQQLKAGEVAAAAQLLGHWWAIAGTVQQGDQRGRTLGFPTANIALGDVIAPALGVYAVRVQPAGAIGADNIWDGVANLGRRPTFDKRDILLEVHLFDRSPDLYGRELRVEFVDFLRAEQKFSGLEALKAQIAEDCTAARARLASPERRRTRFARPTLDGYLQAHPHAPGAPG